MKNLPKTFTECCKIVKVDPTNPKFKKGDKNTIAFEKLKVITKALNPKTFKVDWTNKNQMKWFPYFLKGTSGFRFSSSAGLCWYGLYPGRLAFTTEDLSNYAGRTFKKEYEIYFTK